MLPIAVLVAIVAALAWASSRDAPKTAGAAPKQFGTGSDKRQVKAGKRYRWTVHIRPPFSSEEDLDTFMTNFEAVQPADTDWEFVNLETKTVAGVPTEVLTFNATQLKTQTVGLPWRMLELGGVVLTAVNVKEV